MIQEITIQSDHEDADYLVEQGSALLSIGRKSYITQVLFDFGSVRANILIGRYTSIAHRVVFEVGLNHNHEGNVSTYPFRDYPLHGNDINHYYKNNHYQIIIGNDVWIGEGVRILGGVHIGNGAVIGMGAVVTKDVPPYAVVAGNPARVVKYRFEKVTIEKLIAIRWWNWETERIEKCLPEMDDPVSFADKYYEAPTHYKNQKTDLIDEAISSGGMVFYFIFDSDKTKPFWNQVLEAFCIAFSKDPALTLFLEIPEAFASDDEAAAVEKFISICPGIVPIKSISSDKLAIFTHSTVYIANASAASIPFVDLASLYGISVRSATDYESGLFDR